MITSQTCTKCGIEKPINDYKKCKGYKFGFQRICRECCNAIKRSNYLKDPETYNKKSSLWQQQNRARANENARISRGKRKDEVNAYKRMWRAENKDKVKATRRKSYLSNPQKHNQRTVEWKKKNRAHSGAYHNAYCKVYYSQPDKKLSHSISVLMNRMLQKGKEGKSWRKYVDYSLDELKTHLENKFLPGMTWENYGEWHVDHIVPRVLLPCLSHTEENFSKCWALNNLQPLWKIDNLKKGARLAS